MRIIEHILDTIAPHQCVGCGVEGAVLCAECTDILPRGVSRCYRCQRSTTDYKTCTSCRSSTALYSVRPVTAYQEVAKDIVRQLKFERQRAGAGVIASCLADFDYEPGEIVVHVPTATSRVRQRGYDQAVVIARSLASKTNLVHEALLTRLGQERQVGKNRQERKIQMKELFVAVGNAQNKRIVLVDDVITTGATLEACAAALKKAGAKRVRAVVFAAA